VLASTITHFTMMFCVGCVELAMAPLAVKKIAAECRRRAAEFGEQADTALITSNQQFLLELQRHWLLLASVYEQAENMARALHSDTHNMPDPQPGSVPRGQTVH